MCEKKKVTRIVHTIQRKRLNKNCVQRMTKIPFSAKFNANFENSAMSERTKRMHVVHSFYYTRIEK